MHPRGVGRGRVVQRGARVVFERVPRPRTVTRKVYTAFIYTVLHRHDRTARYDTTVSMDIATSETARPADTCGLSVPSLWPVSGSL
jgi:hypothetical protein